MKVVSIIIPYYQRKKNILSRALKSIEDQNFLQDYEIIIVDDGSPVPCEDELQIFNDIFRYKIKVVKQTNEGPAKARNEGLRHVEKGTKFVAFLDSDDVWESHHLNNAMSVLSKGYDFYFADFYQLGQQISGFNRAKRIQLSDHHPLDDIGNYEFRKNMVKQIITGNIIGTPTVVYRFEKFPDARFREDLVMAGEDYLFWIGLASKTKKIAFSSIPSCRCCDGVNIYSGSGWGSEKSMDLLFYEIKYRKIICDEIDLDQVSKRHLLRKIKDIQKGVFKDILHRIANRKPLRLSIMRKIFGLEPKILLNMFSWSIEIIFSQFVKKHATTR